MKKNFLYNFLLTGSNLLFPLLTFPYLSRILGAEGLGICNFIMSYGQNFIIIAALGMPVYGTREIAKIGFNRKKRSKLFFELLTVHLCFTFLLLIIYIASVFVYADLRNYKELALIGASFILLNVFSIEWLFSGVNDFKYITLRSLFIRCLSVISIFLFVKSKNDLTNYFFILVCTLFFTVLTDVYYARKFISRKIVLTLHGILTHIKPVFILGIYMVLTSIYSVLPATLLGFLSTKLSVGYYYGANKIIRMALSVFSALITVMVPHVNLIVEEKGKDQYFLLVNKALNIVVTFGIPLSFFVFLLANPIVMLLAGKDFINSIFIIKVMAPIILIVAFAQVFVLLILSVNRKDRSMVVLSATGMTISLLVNLIFIPYFAEKAAAISQLVAELLVTCISYIIAKRILNFKFPIKTLILNILLVIPFAIITYLCFMLIGNNFLIILFSSLFCSIYFILYQTLILRNEIVLNMFYPKFILKRGY